jgi:hypothetical protein
LAETETKNREISAASLKEKSFCFSAAKRRSAAGTREKRGLQFCLDQNTKKKKKKRDSFCRKQEQKSEEKDFTSLLNFLLSC